MGKRATGRARRKTYESPVRQDHVERTRERILEAAWALVLDGDKTLAYAAIARRARVSVPTVYRHFPTHDALFIAFVELDQRRFAADGVELDLASLPANTRRFFARFDDPDDLGRAGGRLGVAWKFSRASTVPRRRRYFEELLDGHAPGLPEPQRSYLVELGVVLFSSATGEAFRGYLGRSGAETADRVILGLETLFAYAKSLAEKERKP